MGVFIHPTAQVSDQAVIGDGSKIWINAQVREGARIGKNCVIGKDTYIDFGIHIGDGVKIQNGVSLYHGLTIEDDVFVGPNAAFTNDYYPRAFNGDFEARPTLLKRGASLGANATVVCGHILGEYCLVGAGSVVTHDIPPHALAVGNPARVVGAVCVCGRPLGPDNACPACGFSLRTV